jgi:hypothetical protein
MDALPSPPHRIVLQWKDVEYSATSTRGLIKKSTFTRPILKGISGSVAPGQFLAIMARAENDWRSIIPSLTQ